MGYDTIRLDPDASKICTINFPLGKYSRLPMGRAGSPYFFQDGANGILRCARAYTDDLLCISRKSLDDHLDKLEEVLKRYRDVGLHVHADNRHSAHLKENTWGTYLVKTESNLRVIRCSQNSRFNRPKE